jgi:hypothetical protein
MANGNNYMQEIHNLWRKSLLQFVATDYTILDAFRVIESNPNSPKTTSIEHLPFTNIIEDVYRFVTNPVVKLVSWSEPNHSPIGDFVDGNIPESLLIASDAIIEVGAHQATELNDTRFVDDVRPYIECRIDLLIQQLLSYSLLYSDAHNELKKMDEKTRKDTVFNHIKNTSDIPYLSEVTSIILHFINKFGDLPSSPLPTTGPVTFPPETLPLAREDLLRRFLQYDGTPWKASRGGTTHGGISFNPNSPQTRIIAGLDESFKLLLGLVKVEISIIGSSQSVPGLRDLVAINLDLTLLNFIVGLWGELLRSRSTKSPIVLDYLANELPRVWDYFENSKSGQDVVQHVASAKHAVRTYLESALSDNRDAKIRDLSNNPSVDNLLDNIRSLKNPITNSQPPEDQTKFLFTVWWILTDTPRLSDFHKEAEFYVDPNLSTNPRIQPDNLPKIFPDMIDKRTLAAISRTLSLERIFNDRKKNFSDLNREILTPGGLPRILAKARGIAI